MKCLIPDWQARMAKKKIQDKSYKNMSTRAYLDLLYKTRLVKNWEEPKQNSIIMDKAF